MPDSSLPTILIVDDDSLNRQILAETMQDDCRVLVAKDGERALQRIRQEESIVLVLLDVSMPGLDGYEVIRQLRADPQTAHIGVIFITGMTDESDEQKGLSLGALDYVVKPIRPAIVRARIQNHLSLISQRQELAAQSSRVQLAAAVGRVGIWDAKLASGLIVWNDQMHKLYGISSDGFAGTRSDWEKFIAPEDRAGFWAKWEDAVARGVEFEHEFRIQRADGVWRYVRNHARVFRNPAGKAVRVIGTNWDVTAERETAEAMTRAKDAAEKAEAAKGAFLAAMSHEIRTPMNGIVGMVSLLADTAMTAEQRYFVETVRTSADSLVSIINDILDFSKIEAGMMTFDVQPFDLRLSLENALAVVAEQAHGKGLELAHGFEADVPAELRGDEGRLRQILLNLIGNAVKFTSKGEVSVRVTRVQESGPRCRLRFEISDSGPGITPEVQAKLFRPFVQADAGTTRKFGGTGLGLAISRQLVTLMGGEIGVRSVPGEGSCFWFTASFEPVNAARETPVPESLLSTLKVMLVFPNRVAREMLEHQLQRWGVEVTGFGDVNLAWEAMERATVPRPFDLAIVDHQVGEETGLQFCQRLAGSERGKKMRRFVLSPMGQPRPAAELVEAGVDAWLMKPVRHSMLYNQLVELVAGGREKEKLWPKERESAYVKSERALRILLAEDNAVNQAVARVQLGKLGHHPVIVENGFEAVREVQEKTFDLVLMDCQMPELDGFEATQKIREWEAQRRLGGVLVEPLPIIAMTANAMEGARQTCLDAGMSDYLSKPVQMRELQAVLARVLQKMDSL
jgi:two-component system sensor histidine kinase/response regulator